MATLPTATESSNSPSPNTLDGLSEEDQVLAAIAATLHGSAHPGQDYEALTTYLSLLGHQEGLPEDEVDTIAQQVAHLTLQSLPTEDGVSLAFTDGLATRLLGGSAYARELTMRARFAVNSAKRLFRAWREGGSKGRKAQMGRERAYFQAHKRVAKHREGHLALIDEAARQFGDTLSWRAILDSHTTSECRAMHGRNFSVSNPPAIGLPGLVHPLCRCSVGPPNPHAPTV